MKIQRDQILKCACALFLSDGIDGFYVCGSTGEGPSLTVDERKAVARAYIDAAAGRVPVVVQVGHNSVVEAAELARHAQDAGADVVAHDCSSSTISEAMPGPSPCPQYARAMTG